MTEDLKNNVADTDVSNDENKRETYPIKTFKSIEVFVGNVYKKYGDSDLISNEKIADANNLSVNSIKQVVSTCVQYNSFKKVHGKGYKVTDAFTKIFHPENEEEKNQTIVECIRNVPFYRPLISDYTEKVVPSIEGLQNRFIRDNKMKPHLAKNAADVFVQNLRDFGLLNARNVLIFRSENKSTPPTSNDVNTPNTPNGSGMSNVDKNDKNDQGNRNDLVEIPIRLKNSRMAYLSFPNDFTDEDLKKIFKVAKAYIEAYAEDENFNLDNKNGA